MDAKEYRVSSQDKGYHLFDEPRKFSLRPDIVVTNNNSKKQVVLDTKWKILSSNQQTNYGISQSDMYQMYIYEKKYKSEKVILIYPFNKAIDDSSIVHTYVAKEELPIEIDTMFFDLMDVKGSLERLTNLIGLNNKEELAV